MARDVYDTFLTMIQNNKNISKQHAMVLLAELKDEKRYIEDVWT